MLKPCTLLSFHPRRTWAILCAATAYLTIPSAPLRAQGTAPISGAASKYRGSAKATSVIVFSNIKTANITLQGLAAGRAGDPIEAEPGVNEMVITAPGYGARTFRFLVTNNPKQTITVNIEKERQGTRLFPEPSDADKPVAREKLIGTPSLCQSVTLQPETEHLCSRKSWLDDVQYGGVSWNFEEDIKKFNKPSSELLTRLWYGRRGPMNQRYYWVVEKLFSETPGNQLLYQTVAWNALLTGDCPRVWQIVADADSIGIMSPEMLLISSLCREASGDLKRAQEELTLAGKSNRKLPEITWHQARLLFAANRQQAALKLLDCIKKFPHFAPCYETMMVTSEPPMTTATLKQREDSWRKANDAAFTTWTKKYTELTRSGRWPEATLALTKGANEFRVGYEIEWAEFIATAAQRLHQTGDAAPTPPGPATLLGSPYGAEALSLQVEALKNAEWTALSIEPLLRLNPADKKHWYRLIDSHIAARNWNGALQAIERAESNLPNQGKYLMSQKAKALVGAGRSVDALAIYRALQKDEPTSWKSNYNLASALERAEKIEEALPIFRRVLGLSPPEQIQVAIESKLNAYEVKRRKMEARGKLPPEESPGADEPPGLDAAPLPPAAGKTAP